MPSMPGPVNSRVPGYRRPTLINVAFDRIGKAIAHVESASKADSAEERVRCLTRAKEYYQAALLSARESKAERSDLCAVACALAIERLDLALSRPGHVVDVTAALRPDLGQADEAAQREADAAEAKREASRHSANAAYNARKYATEIASITKALPRLRVGSVTFSTGARLLADLASGERRGFSETMWNIFADGCRREGVTL